MVAQAWYPGSEGVSGVTLQNRGSVTAFSSFLRVRERCTWSFWSAGRARCAGGMENSQVVRNGLQQARESAEESSVEPSHSLGAGLYMELFIDSFNMGAYGGVADLQFVGDLLVKVTFGKKG